MATQPLGRHDGRLSLRDRLAIVGRDAHFALRAIRRSPAFAATATLTLALSVGATTAVFGVVDAILIRPLPVADPDRLVSVFEVNPGRGIAESPPSGPNYLDWRKDARSFTGLAAYRQESLTLTGVSSPDVLDGAGVSANFFDVLGIPPTLGRTFRPEEEAPGASHVVLVSHRLWQGRYGVITEPAAIQRGTLPSDITSFISRSEAKQKIAAEKYEAGELATNYNLLQVWDLMSLYICSTETHQPDRIAPVPVAYSGGASVAMTLTPVEADAFAIEPYPFNQPELTASVIFRRLRQAKFKDAAELQAAYFSTAPQVASFKMTPLATA